MTNPWTLKRLATNLLAGLTVAVVALPLALAFGIGSGLGAQAGIVTAVIAGALAAAFGGSRYQVSGPTGAMTVILIPIVANYGPVAVLQVGLMSAAFLFLAAALRLGNLVRKLPTALIEGFTAGIAVVIALQQVAFLLGVPLAAEERIWQSVHLEVLSWLQKPGLEALTVGVAVTAVNLALGNRWPRIPIALFTIIGATLIAITLRLEIETIGELPAIQNTFSLDFLAAGNWLVLIPPAMAVAFLAGLESLLSATIADRLANDTSHRPNRELFGQGLANLAVPFFGGVPATAALARTAVNVRAGANSRLSAIFHALMLLVFVLLLSPWIAQIPLAALAGVLVATAYRMVKISELRHTAGKSHLDAWVLVITLISTVVLDLISALLVGLAIFLALRKSRLAKAKIPIEPTETLGD